MLISVIIPVFNGEIYLTECLESVTACPIDDIECIIINDGSSDMSKDISSEYVSKDSRFKLINKENTGVSDSRNIGVHHAIGKFIFFLDADDFIKIDTWDLIIEQARSDYDMIAFSYYSLFESGDKKIELYQIDGKVSESKKDINHILLSTPMLNTCWGKLLKRQIILENKLKFNNLKTCEDAIFIIDFIQASDKHRICNTNILYYRINKYSVMNTTDVISKLDDFSKLYLRRNEYYLQNCDDKLYQKLYRNYFSFVTDLMVKQALKYDIKSLRYLYIKILSTPPVDKIILEVDRSSLSPPFKKLEYIFMKHNYIILLAVYFKIKSYF